MAKVLVNRLGPGLLRSLQRSLEKKTPVEVERVGERFGRLAGRLDRRRRQTAESNLAMAFPDWSEQKVKATAWKVFEHFGRSSADFLVSHRLTLEEIESTSEIINPHAIDEALALNRGIIMITGHLGNWERLSGWVSRKGYKLSVVYRDANQGTVNDLVSQLRLGPGTELIPRGQAARPILEKLRKNEMVGILPDQNSNEHFTEFFGKPCGTVLGPGVIHARTQAPVLPCWCIYEGRNRYRMIFEETLEAPPGEPKGAPMMAAINRRLEAIIREYPEQWLWIHDRWRTARKAGLL